MCWVPEDEPSHIAISLSPKEAISIFLRRGADRSLEETYCGLNSWYSRPLAFAYLLANNRPLWPLQILLEILVHKILLL